MLKQTNLLLKHITDLNLLLQIPDPIGRACILPADLGQAITAVDCAIVRLKPAMIPGFFIALTKSSDYRAQIDAATVGTTRARISRGNLGKVLISVPALDLQRQFVEISDAAEATKTALQKSIADLDQVMKGLINE